jgi:hypothetical protein
MVITNCDTLEFLWWKSTWKLNRFTLFLIPVQHQSTWVINSKSQWRWDFHKWSNLYVARFHSNSEVKPTSTRLVLGWVTFQQKVLIHLSQQHGLSWPNYQSNIKWEVSPKVSPKVPSGFRLGTRALASRAVGSNSISSR